MTGLFVRIFKQLLNDKRSLALLIIAPLAIMTMLYFLLGESSYQPVIAVNNTVPQNIINVLSDKKAEIVQVDASDNVDKMLKEGEIDAYVSVGVEGVTVRMLEADSVKVQKISEVFKETMSEVLPFGSFNITFIYGQGSGGTFENFGYILLGFISFFIVFLLSGVSFIRERTTGTLERLMLTPIRRSEVITGYTFGFGFFAALQSVIIVLFFKYALSITFNGSLLLCVVIMVLLAFTAVATGTLISIFANNEFQVVQFIPVIIIPQFFFSGILSVETFPLHLGFLSYFMPLYYGCSALKEVMLKGSSLGSVWLNMLVLFLFIVALSFINILALKKYRKM